MSLFDELMTLEQTGPTTFVAPAAPESDGRMFGGQLLAQGLVAASHTADSDRVPHSLHAYFLRAGNVDDPLDVEVDVVRDGRSFSTRAATLSQGGRELFRAMISFHVPEPGLEYSPPTMPPCPGPEEVTMTYADFSAATAADDWDGAARPIDILYANAPTAAEGVPVTESQKMWLRIRDAVSANPVVHLAGLAYLSDATLIDHALLPHGHRWHDDRLVGASLDHTMYFHRPAECDEWLLYDQTVEFTGGSRGVASGTLYRRDGTIVATTLQEGLIRWSE